MNDISENIINEYNCIIAEFVGLKTSEKCSEYAYECWLPMNEPVWYSDEDKSHSGNYSINKIFYDNVLTSLKYNYSWNDLMSVVEKIESIYDNFHGYFGVHISSNSCSIQGTNLRTDPENPCYAYFNETYGDNKIQATWLAVVSFIKWYTNYKDNL